MELERRTQSGPNWWIGILGVLLLAFSLLSQIGGSDFSEIWVLWLFGFMSLWSFRVGEAKLRGQALIKRNVFWRKKSHDLAELKWIDFGQDKTVTFWIGSDFVRLQPPFWKYKKLESAVRHIGEANIPYFDYRLVERSILARKQLSGCLDCHSTFLPTDLKAWSKLPKSILWGRKKDQHFAYCPNCKGSWVYTSPNPKRPVTQRALQEMDAIFKLDKKTKMREIIGESLTRQAVFQHGQ